MTEKRKYEIENKTVYKTDDDLPPPNMSLLGRATKKGPETVFYMARGGVTFMDEAHRVIERPKYWRFNIEKT